MRLNKTLAHAGVCSRRKADELVFAGRVTINGVTADSPGVQVDPATDAIAVDGRGIAAPIEAGAEHVYILLNKPLEVVTTASDPQGRRTVLDLLPEKYAGRRLYPAGRLDYFSEGLTLVTDDGELTFRMTHPRHHLPKVYRALVRAATGEAVDEAKLDVMRHGMTLAEGEKLAPVRVRVLERRATAGGQTALLEMTLVQGVNRQIRRMCRDVGLTVLKLRRTAVGPLTLSGLAPGMARELHPQELAELRKALGLGG